MAPPLLLDQLLAAAIAHVPGWKLVSPAEITVTSMMGGMSNAMYLLQTSSAKLANGAPSSAVGRVVAGELNGAIDRERELRVVQYVGTTGIGPLLYATVIIQPRVKRSGRHLLATSPATAAATAAAASPTTSASPPQPVTVRFEQYVQGRTLAVGDMHRYVMGARMGVKVAQFHAQHPDLRGCTPKARRPSRAHLLAALGGASSSGGDVAASSSDSPAPASPLAQLTPAVAPAASASSPAVPASCSTAAPGGHRGAIKPSLFNQLRTYLRLQAEARLSAWWAGLDPRLHDLSSMCDWRTQVVWLDCLMALKGGPTVLAHGDLQPGNWILGPPPATSNSDSNGSGGASGAQDKLYLIDYEYSSYCQRGFDTGNIFCEHTFDYSLPHRPGYTMQPIRYPSLQWQRTFLACYHAENSLVLRNDGTISDEDELVVPLAACAGLDDTPQCVVEELAGSLPAAALSVPELTISPLGALGRHATSASADASSSSASGSSAVASDAACSPEEIWQRTTISRSYLDATFPTPGIRQLVREARVGLLASHLYWSLWGLVMGAGKGIAAAEAAAEAAAAEEESRALAAATGGEQSGEHSEEDAAADGPVAPVSGAPLFDYACYGLDRAAEYQRLQQQLQRDAPELAAEVDARVTARFEAAASGSARSSRSSSAGGGDDVDRRLAGDRTAAPVVLPAAAAAVTAPGGTAAPAAAAATSPSSSSPVTMASILAHIMNV